MTARAGLLTALVFLGVLASSSARAGDPDQVWQTIETQHFAIHYDQRLEDVARRVGIVAERSHRTLSPVLGHEPNEKTQVVLLDQTDGANGFANVIPRNAITLYLTSPTGSSNLSDHDDWLYTLFAHEYTHVLHLDTMSGLPTWVAAVLGKTWAPNQVMPRWVIEGIATYEESKHSAGGRTRSSQFDMFLRGPTLQGKALRLDQVTANPIRFPRGNAAYLYGSRFLRYIFDRFGDDKLAKMSHSSGAHPIPFGINRQISSVIGKSFDTLYDDWSDYRRDRYALQAQAVERRGVTTGRQLTSNGETNLAPHYTPDGRELWWLQGDGYSSTKLRAMPVASDVAAARDIGVFDGIGAWTIMADGQLVFERSISYRRDYQFQDLYRFDPRTQRTTRLTRGARARDPAGSPDQSLLAFGKNGISRSDLATIPTTGAADPTVVWRGQGRYDQAFQPTWSPDGKRIAFSAWRAGGLRDILIVTPSTGEVVEVTRDRAIDGSPAWSRDGGTLYFDSDRTGISNIYAYKFATGTLWQVTNVLGGAFECALSPDGKRLAYHGFVGFGYDLFEVELDESRFWPARTYVDDRPPPTVVADDEAEVSAPRAYRPIETLAPQSWTASLALGTLTQGTTISTSGIDAAGRHSYALNAGLDFERGNLNIGTSYSYNGFRPSLRFSGLRTVAERNGYNVNGVNTAYLEESLGGTISVGVPSERPPGQSFSLNLDYSVDYSRIIKHIEVEPDPNQQLPQIPDDSYLRAGVGVRVSYSKTRAATYSLGSIEGYDFSVSTRYDDPKLGATYRALSLGWNARAYYTIPHTKVTTVTGRLAGGIRTGDVRYRGVYGLGGLPTQDIAQSVVDNTRASSTGYLRGYPSRSVVGNQYHLANVEVRQPIVDIERGLATLPLYIRRLHAAGLVDAATAFDDTFTQDTVRVAVGAALRLDITLGYYIGGTLELGYARGLVNGGIGTSWLLLTSTL